MRSELAIAVSALALSGSTAFGEDCCAPQLPGITYSNQDVTFGTGRTEVLLSNITEHCVLHPPAANGFDSGNVVFHNANMTGSGLPSTFFTPAAAYINQPLTDGSEMEYGWVLSASVALDASADSDSIRVRLLGDYSIDMQVEDDQIADACYPGYCGLRGSAGDSARFHEISIPFHVPAELGIAADLLIDCNDVFSRDNSSEWGQCWSKQVITVTITDMGSQAHTWYDTTQPNGTIRVPLPEWQTPGLKWIKVKFAPKILAHNSDTGEEDGFPSSAKVATFDVDSTVTLEFVHLDEPCRADFDGDGDVDVDDMNQLLAAWGPCTCCIEDIDCNGIVDTDDLLALNAMWGPCP